MNQRLEKLRQKLAEEGLEGLLVSQMENRRYLSGFTGTAGYLLITQDLALLATDFRYRERAGLQAPTFEIIQIEGEPEKWFPTLAPRLGIKRLGFEAHDLSYAVFLRLAKAGSGIELAPTQGLVEGLRTIKEPAEVTAIQKAMDLTDAAFEEVAFHLEPGVTEGELAWALERFMRERGSEGLAFEMIVASGTNASMPHPRRPGGRVIQAGEPVIIDIGARVDAYCADMTRTVFVGPADATLARVYDAVLGAQLTALATLEVGMTGAEVDSLARRVLEEAGYGDAFGHGLGHGVGLAVHELPRLGKASVDKIEEGMVVTIEPGVYLPGWGGVRIEDTVVIENGRARVLGKAAKTEVGGHR